MTSGNDPAFTSIDNLGLSVRASNCLRAAHKKTIKDVLDFGFFNIYAIPHCGPKTCEEIRLKLRKRGYVLRNEENLAAHQEEKPPPMIVLPITKRELFAAMAMQGLIQIGTSHPETKQEGTRQEHDWPDQAWYFGDEIESGALASDAVRLADSLIAELNK